MHGGCLLLVYVDHSIPVCGAMAVHRVCSKEGAERGAVCTVGRAEHSAGYAQCGALMLRIVHTSRIVHRCVLSIEYEEKTHFGRYDRKIIIQGML